MNGATLTKHSSAPQWRKPLQFALYTALGCLLAAMLGELWLLATKPAPPPPPPPPPPTPAQAVVLLLDTSGSMAGGALDEMKKAARDYVARQDLSRTRIAVVHFDSTSEARASLTRDPALLNLAIDSLHEDGVTRMDLGLDVALQQLNGAPGAAQHPAFTDGVPTTDGYTMDASDITLQKAQQVRQGGVRLLAIATGDADRDFLAQLTGDAGLVFWASQGQFGEAFQQAARVIAAPATRQLVESAPSEGASTRLSLLRTSIWTGLLGLGAALALLLAQKRYMRHQFAASDWIGAAGALVAGCLAGMAGQVLFAAVADTPLLSVVARLSAWALLGGGLGWGMALFVPNLQRERAAQGGALGGALGAVGFLCAAGLLGDIAARLIGAAIIGFFIGLMVVLAEVAFRKAWLHVSYGPLDAFDVNLGALPIGVGSDRAQCRVLARETAPLAARYGLEHGRVYYEDAASGRRSPIDSGDIRTFGNVTITVFGEAQNVETPRQGGSDAPPLHAPLPSQPMPYATPPIQASSSQAPPLRSSPLPQQSWRPPVETPPVAAPVWILAYSQSPLRLPANGQASLGRGANNDIVLSDASVSMRHAQFQVSPDALAVTDLGSTNGTFVNGQRLAANVPTRLRVGDALMLGRQQYTVQLA